MIDRFSRAVRHPIRTLKRLVYGPPPPAVLSVEEQNRAAFLRYSDLARLQGFKRLYILLSFDCDTPEDIGAAQQLDGWLQAKGIKTTYCVPGEQLLQGADVYRSLADNGADFISHGAQPHAELRDERYWPVTFYDKMTDEQVVEDITRADHIFRQVLGRPSVGFRAPHFGYFQSAEQRSVIYRTIGPLGYRFSTSTLPVFALQSGPVLEVEQGLFEIPLSGYYQAPGTILDSWNNIESPYHPKVTDTYAKLFVETVEKLLALNVVGVLNYYVDPYHVSQTEAFEKAVRFLEERKVPSINYGDLLRMMEK